MSDPTALSWWLFGLAILTSIAFAAQGERPWRLSRPSSLTGVMALVMVTFGTWSYYATREFFPQFYVPINQALAYAALGLGVATVAASFMSRAPHKPHAGTSWSWSVTPLDHLVLAYTLLAILGTLGSLARIGYVPLLRGDIREERLLYADQAGIFFRMSLLGASAAVLGGVRWMRFGRSTLAVVATPLGVLCTALYGPRFFPFVVIGILFICYDTYVRRIRIVRALAGTTAVVALGIAAAVHRESSGTFVFQQGLGPIDTKTAINAVGYVSVPEFRDFAWSLDYFSEPRRRLSGATLAGATTAFLPAAVWQFVGVDKDALYSRDSGTIMAEVLGQDTGIRIGILGELYMNFGLSGILVGMALFGVFVAWQDRWLSRASLSHPGVPFVALLAIVSTFSLIGILHMFVSAVVLFGWPLLLAAALGSRSSRDDRLPLESTEAS